MTYAAWEPRYRVTTIPPGKIDLFVATFVDGTRAALWPVYRYDEALATARAFHREHPRCQIKVLPLSGAEVVNILGIKPADPGQPIDPADRRAVVDNLMQIAGDSADPEARRDALDLLEDMGAIQL